MNDSVDVPRDKYSCMFPYVKRFTAFKENEAEFISLSRTAYLNLQKDNKREDISVLIRERKIDDNCIKDYIDTKILYYDDLIKKVTERFCEHHNINY